MYSDYLEKIFKKGNITVGDRIRVEGSSGAFEGLLMPRTYESSILVLKLDNGYNIGINSKDAKVALIEKTTRKPVPEESESSRGEIAILGCGGTIASKVEYTTGAVFPAISPQELRAAFPALDRLASIHTRQIFSLFSEDLTVRHWQLIADAISEEIRKGIRGIVLMHGTDVMHYSSAAISFMLQGLQLPVIFVGAQRSSDRPSSENEMNMMNAVYAAKQDFAGVGICMHATSSDDFCHLHSGVRARKFHTSRRDAFRSVNALPFAKVDYRNNLFEALSSFRTRSPGQESRLKTDTRMSDKVAMVYVHPGIRPEFIKKLKDYEGIVFVGTGLGHIPMNPFSDRNAKSLLPAVTDLIASDIPVVMSSQAVYGRLDLKVYTTGRLLSDAGVIGDGCDWLPEAAYVKLAWVLGHTKNMKKIKEEMLTNLAGEISERSIIV